MLLSCAACLGAGRRSRLSATAFAAGLATVAATLRCFRNAAFTGSANLTTKLSAIQGLSQRRAEHRQHQQCGSQRLVLVEQHGNHEQGGEQLPVSSGATLREAREFGEFF